MTLFFNEKEELGAFVKVRNVFRNELGVIDLASIMVSIVVIGMIGGTIAATVFAVIPWTQDNAAKHQLVSLHSAQNAYYGASSDPSVTMQTGFPRNSFFDSSGLEAAGLMKQGTSYCTVATDNGQNYSAYSKSATGNIFISTNSEKTASILPAGEVIPAPCDFLLLLDADTGNPDGAGDNEEVEANPDTSDETAGGSGSGTDEGNPDDNAGGEETENPDEVGGDNESSDPTPTMTIMTFRCNIIRTGYLPMSGIVKGTESWSDGVTKTYNSLNLSQMQGRTLQAGVTYTATFDGTYTKFGDSDSSIVEECLRSVDYWGSATGVVDASYGFADAGVLTNLPANIPPTIKKTRFMFDDAEKFNDPNISSWDVSNVTDMTAMFIDTVAFNQPLDSWNVSNVTNMSQMFDDAEGFNQPLNSWDVSNVTNMFSMFDSAERFNQNLNSWNVSKVTNMSKMFYEGDVFNGNIENWTTSEVTNMSSMFFEAKRFNGNIAGWNVSKVTNMNKMFLQAESFNQNLSGWNTISLTNGTEFAPIGFNSAYMPLNTSK